MFKLCNPGFAVQNEKMSKLEIDKKFTVKFFGLIAVLVLLLAVLQFTMHR